MARVEISGLNWVHPHKGTKVLIDGEDVTNDAYAIEIRVDGTYVCMFTRPTEIVDGELAKREVKADEVVIHQ